ncbi:MAG TPA: hypothetical protein VF765_30145 [Polyangiaceae bacterium]
MAFSHPYRIPEFRVARPPSDAVDVLRGAQSLIKLFLVGWSLLRVGVCSTRGIDVEGCAALLVVIAMASSLFGAWSRFS